MIVQTLEVQSHIMGNTRPELALQPVYITVEAEHCTLAELICRTVEAQLADLQAQHNDTARVQEVLERHYLSNEEIVSQTRSGMVRMPKTPTTKVPPDTEMAQQRALHAFTRQAYVVLVNGEQVEQLDDLVICMPQTKVIFLRLMPLAGG
jgi:hypothetical protein